MDIALGSLGRHSGRGSAVLQDRGMFSLVDMAIVPLVIFNVEDLSKEQVKQVSGN